MLGGLATAFTLVFSSCGDDQSTSDKPDGAQSPTASAEDDYPLDVCVVSGEKLGSMGKPHVIHHEGVEVRFCCKECLPEFNKDPGKYISMLKKGKAGSMDHGN